jgi:hypothetical protein
MQYANIEGAGFAGVQPARVHPGDVGDEIGLDTAGALQKLRQSLSHCELRR